jgi:ABC-type transport system involved in cytochrome c biogenesis permease subunit
MIGNRLLTIVGAIGIAAALQVYTALPPHAASGSFDYNAFGNLLVQDGGRIKPLDTVARVALTVINHRQSCRDAAGREIPPVKWLLEVMALTGDRLDSDIAKTRLFRIDNPQVVQQLGLENRPGSWRYSFAELQPKFGLIEAEGQRADAIEQKHRSLADQRILELGKHLEEFLKLNDWRLAVIPSAGAARHEPWTTPAAYRPEELERRTYANIAEALRKQGSDARNLSEEEGYRLVTAERKKLLQAAPAAAQDFVALLQAYQDRDPERFNKLVEDYRGRYGDDLQGDMRRAGVEVLFNRAAPFHYAMWLYLVAFLFVLCGWVTMQWSPNAAGRCYALASALTVWTFLVHTLALFFRMYISDRPLVFVTNLYSSAIFIGWCSAAIGLVVEKLRGRGIGTALTGVAGASSLIVAHFIDLGMEGDKLEMMQAVLDTNFWLATHVTTVTFGYAATFVAGLLGMAFIILGVMTPYLDRDLTKVLSGLIYGVVCFATLLSFTGTVLGGIWADYSWGRFWGWDPKENGAMLIVLWNALILHARWGGLVKSRGMAVLAVFGNIVTGWSWFGTNQLGVGLHSYGFTSAAAMALVTFNVAMLCVMGIGMLPETTWLSRKPSVAKSDSTN